MKSIQYSIVVPVYNSADIIEELANQVNTVMERAGFSYELILVDDGSGDGSWRKIADLARGRSQIRGYRLSNNFGQWMAAMAGISRAQGEYIITMDDDLEYDPADILTLIGAYSKGDYYLVFGLAKDKYKLQGKNGLLASWRNRFINLIWQKFLTDSFKLFSRKLVFEGDKFVPKVHFEAFVNATVTSRYVGYCEVAYRKRFAGTSNHTLAKKMQLFFHHTIEYYRYPAYGLSVLLIVLSFLMAVFEYYLFRERLNGFLSAFISFAELALLLLILHYTAPIYHRVNALPDYWIIDETSNHLDLSK